MDLSLGFISLTISLIAIILSQKYFLNNNFVDNINHRSSHSSIATRSGGLSIFITLFILSIYHYIGGNALYDYSIISPLILLLSIGLYDDIFEVDFKLKFIFQIIAAKMIIDNGLIIDNFHGIFGLFEISRIYAHIMTIFIIVAIINAINFIDGIDGLAISVTLFFIILFESLSAEVTPYIKMSLIVLFSIFPLYIFNFKKTKKVFIGDSGSLFLGGIISTYVIYILSNDYIIVKQFDVHKVIFVFSLLSYPIVDLIRVFFLRVIKGDSPFKADKNHIHHILLKKINNHKVVSLIIIVCSVSVFLTIQLLVNFI